jgi:hypothetical protein
MLIVKPNHEIVLLRGCSEEILHLKVKAVDANIPSIQNAQKNLINPKVIPKKFYG